MQIDTDVIIRALRRVKPAVAAIEGITERKISVITYMEMVQGGRNNQEIRQLKQYLSYYNFSVLPLTENIGHRALVYMEEYRPSTGLTVDDSLIAATAAENQLVLLTGNLKHYRAIRDLEIKPFRP
ncbi:MAG TPA: type II toxin-antitoxin system VapC family toxin [bacterium]|nr:type II toxin-antitoxin system VapC family toxin [bacterium]